MTDDGWLRDKLFQHAHALGINEAKQEATERSVEAIRTEMREGFDKIDRSVAAQINHVRGEIKTLADHIDDRLQAIEDDAAKTRRTLRALLIGIGVLLSLLQGAQMFVSAPIAQIARDAIPLLAP